MIPKLAGKNLPWYILDDQNGILITSPTIPTSIKDSKAIVWAEVNIPGLNYTPLYPNRLGNRKVSFTIPIINRKTEIGNSNLIKQFDILRNSDTPSLFSLLTRGEPAQEVPSVIYQWGLPSGPLRYKVRKCDYTHDSRLTSASGFSKYTLVDVELELDEESLLYRADTIARRVQALLGNVQSIQSITAQNGRPY